MLDAIAGEIILPAQALAEMCRVLLHKRRPPYKVWEIEPTIHALVASCLLIPLTSEVVLEALRGVQQHGFSYYDAQIWAAARLGGADVLLSEDFQSGRTVEGVTFVNPFDPAFRVATL